ncbi:hypothetical protein I3I95_10730 [bacterium]|nr:hypothetical protein [bacterium]
MLYYNLGMGAAGTTSDGGSIGIPGGLSQSAGSAATRELLEMEAGIERNDRRPLRASNPFELVTRLWGRASRKAA